MHLLFVSYGIPEYDKYSGDLRFYQLLKLLAQAYEVTLYSTAFTQPEYRRTHSSMDLYVESLKSIGIKMERGDLSSVLRNQSYQTIVFEWFATANQFIEIARIWSPKARLVVDTIDVHYRRLFAKAQLTKNREDFEIAQKMKEKELAAYLAADAIIAVSEPDKLCVLEESATLPVYVIPNIHPEPESRYPSKGLIENSMIFVGNFNHEPNADAIRYFCREIFPLILKAKPDAKLRIIGSDPPEDLKVFASNNVEILGYIDDLNPYLTTSCVSIAPVRYGAGLKGKIGQAMSFGLPVVTTSVGADGFGIVPGEHLLIGDTSEEFVRAVLQVLEDKQLHRSLSIKSRSFIKARFSEEAVRTILYESLEKIVACPVKKLPIRKQLSSRIKYKYNLCKYKYDQYVGWRFSQHR